MAEDENSDNETGKDADTKKSGSKKKLVVMIVVGLLIVGLSVGGTLFAVKLLSPTDPEVSDTPDVVEDPPPPPAIYFPLKPAVIVNFSNKGRQRFLQVELTMMTREEDVVSAIELHQPMIRNALVLLIGGQIFSDIQTAEGKELLRQQCLQEVQRLLEQEIGKPGVEQVLFTSFILQ